jgi:putative tryptophan/tyrosine transport system substrate-binding protein
MQRRDFLGMIGATALSTCSGAAWPLVARAQQTMPVVGFINGASLGGYAPYVAAFHRGLRENGFIEGQNVAIEYRWAEGHYDRFGELAADLVRRQVAVIAATGNPGGPIAAKMATTTIPIVFSIPDDPLQLGLVTSLARPGGNVTGITAFVDLLAAKRLELIRDLISTATLIGILMNRTATSYRAYAKDIQEAANLVGQQIEILDVGSEDEMDTAFATLARLHAGALLVVSDNFFVGRRERLVQLAARYVIPTIYENRDFTVAGGLMSYGASLVDVYRQVGVYVGRILKGAKAADLPVLQPTKFELVINVKTARALGLTIPPSLLARADEVIE